MSYKVVIDPGHGGKDSGAVYNGRMEKDDNLQLAMAVGDALEDKGVDVVFTRTEDVYDTPFEKAQKGNEENADLFVSIHRNAFDEPNVGTGVETLVFDKSGIKLDIANSINKELEKLGFENRGVTERPNLVVLKRTKMPALLVEAGFIDSDMDNELFDKEFYNIAKAIANGIVENLDENQIEGHEVTEITKETIEEFNNVSEEEVDDSMMPDAMDEEKMKKCCPDCEKVKQKKYYRVQVGAFRNQGYAEKMVRQLTKAGYPAYIMYEKGLYKVQVGAYENIDNAAKMEDCLRRMGYSTYIRTM